MKKRVIYTSIVGAIDSLMQPQVIDPRYDYICFVRKADGIDGGIWQIREIPACSGDDRMLSRYPKLHPAELLPGYEWTLWMDGNLRIRSQAFYDLLDDLIAGGVQMAVPLHPLRDCIYDEARAVVAADKESCSAAMRVIGFLKDKGFPRHAGLYENAVLLRRGGDPALAAMDSMWWGFLQTLSGRDQLSMVYCARKCSVSITPLLPEGCMLRDCEYLEYVFHDRVTKRPWFVRKWNDFRRRIAKWRLQRVIDRI